MLKPGDFPDNSNVTYISCIMSCGNKIVSKIVSYLNTEIIQVKINLKNDNTDTPVTEGASVAD